MQYSKFCQQFQKNWEVAGTFYFWDLSGTYLWDLSGTYLWDLSKTCLGPVWDFSGTCLGLSETCQELICGTCLKLFRDLANIALNKNHITCGRPAESYKFFNGRNLLESMWQPWKGPVGGSARTSDWGWQPKPWKTSWARGRDWCLAEHHPWRWWRP